MYKIFAVLVILILAGGGCVNKTADQDSNSAEDNAGASMMVPAENGNGAEEMVINNDELDPELMEEGGAEPVEAPDAVTLNMESGNFFFEPALIEAAPGQRIEVTVTKNEGFHTFVIDEINFKVKVEEGETFNFTAPEEPGDYAFYCDIGSHRSLGMEGVLRIN